MPVNPVLLKAIPGVGLTLVAGGVGSGKSCLVYSLLEAFHQIDTTRPCAVFNFPKEKAHLLPDYIKPTDDLNFPERSIVVADEAYMAFHSKDQNSDNNKFMDLLSGLVRQKELLVFFVTQTTRKLSLAQTSSAQSFLVKMPDIMMVKLDRRELRGILEAAMKGFRALPVAERQEALYVVSTEYEGMLQKANTPPGFWTPELSTAWQGVELTTSQAIHDPTLLPAPKGSNCDHCNAKLERRAAMRALNTGKISVSDLKDVRFQSNQ